MTQDKNAHLAVWRGGPDRQRIREILWDFPVIGNWIYDKRNDRNKLTASKSQRWQFIGTY